MIQDSSAVINVDDFLAEHRRKINEDKRVLSEIFNFLQEKQQDNGDYQQDDSLNKLDQKSTDCQENNPFSAQDLYKDDNRRVMVRYGEFSPLNPAFRSSSRPLLGLGEYEERRKIFLERKKREYLQYLLKAKNEKEREKKKSRMPETIEENENRLSNQHTSTTMQNMPREIFSPGRGIIEDTDRCFTRWQQQAYRRDLDRQISDKRRRLIEEKQRDKEECEIKNKELMMMEKMKICQSMTDKLKQYKNIEIPSENSLTGVDFHEKENLPIFYQNRIINDGAEFSPKRPNSAAQKLAFNRERSFSPIFNAAPNHSLDIHHENRNKPLVSPIFNKAADHSIDIEPENNTKPFVSPLFNTTSNHSVDIQPALTHRVSSPVFTATSNRLRNYLPNRANGPNHHTKAPASDDSIEFEFSKKPLLQSPLSPASDSESYLREQKERYKNELKKQIEEKRKLEMERKRKEKEEEKKLEKKAKAEEEKLRKEYEKEQAERTFRAAQKVQQEVRLQDHLRKIQVETEERKKAARRAALAVASKQTVFPTDHGVTSKGSMKNVSFAPNAYVHSIRYTNGYLQSDEISSSEHRKADSDVLVEAPYELAVKGNDVRNINSHGYPERPPSPPVPAVRTKKLMKSLPKTDSIIPPTVSMSEEARERFLKDSNIISNLSEIRRKLLENQIDLSAE